MGGIVIIAIGHQNYTEMAVNLAASIKANGAQAPIALLHNGGYDSLPGDKQRMFEKNIRVKEKFYERGFIQAKTHLYELSPFDKTLYLDADMLALVGVNFDNLLSELDGVEFTIMNEKAEHCIWANVDDLRKYCGDSKEPLHIMYSELMYFEKGEKTKAYFAEVKKAHKEITFQIRAFAGGVADELAFIAASLKTGMMPHQSDWKPVFWDFRDKQHRHLQAHQLSKFYYGYSAGGNYTNKITKSNYNNLTLHYSQVMKYANPYKLVDKRAYLKERSII